MSSFDPNSQLEKEMQEALTCELPRAIRQEMYENIIKGMKSYGKHRRRRRILGTVAGVAAVAVLSTGLAVYGGTLKGLLVNAGRYEPDSTNMIKKTDAPFQYPPRARVMADEDKLSPADQAKCQLLEKVGYAYENFQTIKGTFFLQDSRSRIQPIENIDFQVREGPQPASYEKVTIDGKPKQEFITDGQYGYSPQYDQEFVDFGPAKDRLAGLGMNYFITKMDPGPPGTPPDPYSYGVPHDPANTQWAKQIIAPLGDLPNELLKLEEWKISGVETVMNRQATTVTGFSRGLHFKIWFDQDTGILLKEQSTNSSGTIVMNLEVQSLQINVPLDENLFNIQQATINKLKKLKDDQMKKQEEMPRLETVPVDSEIPKEILPQWQAAKNVTDHTTIIPYQNMWFIYPKKGCLVDTIEINGSQGTVRLVKASAQKGTIPAVAVNYHLTTLVANDDDTR